MSQAALAPLVSPAAPAAVMPSGRRPGIADDPVIALNAPTRLQKFRGTMRIAGFVGLIVLGIPVQWVMLKTRIGRKVLPFRFHRVMARVLGMRVTVKGKIADGGGVLIAANHTSWLDIVAISTVGPVSFVAKSQVGTWPVFKTLAKLQETILVVREKRSKTAEHRDTITGRLALGDNIVLFPEGTSSDGNRVLPFKSALMSAAEGEVPQKDGSTQPIRVQPMSVAYTRLAGLPMGRRYRPFFAWYGDMDLVPHLMEGQRMGPIHVEITIHEPTTVKAAGSRKALAEQCETLIRETVAQKLTGRPH